MAEKKELFDIVKTLGGVDTLEEAKAVFNKRLNEEHLARLLYIQNPEVLIKIANAMVMCEPDSIYINTGTEADRQYIRKASLAKGEEAPLAMEGHTIHYDLKDEQGRIVDRTYYIYNEGEAVSSLANKMLRDKAYEDIQDKMKGIMKGKTMIVGFYSRGPVGAPA
ncbi:MAG: phosphoenolpyruvate carboxykinase, partial [Proteobacteria bacterium]|nr:phosphoenolpyruvate carboxykinase [Pseudomonadota bacterium]